MNKILMASFNRKNDNQVYQDGDVIGVSESNANGKYESQMINFAGGPVGKIGQVQVITNNTRKLNCELWLFNAPLPYVDHQVEDNDPFEVRIVDCRNLLTIIPLANQFTSPKGISVLQGSAEAVSLSGAGTLKGVLVVRGSYTPIPKQEFLITIAFAD